MKPLRLAGVIVSSTTVVTTKLEERITKDHVHSLVNLTEKKNLTHADDKFVNRMSKRYVNLSIGMTSVFLLLLAIYVVH